MISILFEIKVMYIIILVTRMQIKLHKPFKGQKNEKKHRLNPTLGIENKKEDESHKNSSPAWFHSLILQLHTSIHCGIYLLLLEMKYPKELKDGDAANSVAVASRFGPQVRARQYIIALPSIGAYPTKLYTVPYIGSLKVMIKQYRYQKQLLIICRHV